MTFIFVVVLFEVFIVIIYALLYIYLIMHICNLLKIVFAVAEKL